MTAGRAVSLFGVKRLHESHNLLQSTLNSFRFKNNNLLEKSLKK
jgi:hypothetical protein